MLWWFRSPGYGLVLVSESTEGTTQCAEGLSTVIDKQGSSDDQVVISPEDIGTQTAIKLVEEIVKVHVYHAVGQSHLLVVLPGRVVVRAALVRVYLYCTWH